MTLVGLRKRIRPLLMKIGGKLPLCPWRSVLAGLDFRTLNIHPPAQQIEEIPVEGSDQLFRFNDIHNIWFPSETKISPEMWSEYLAVFWKHPANAHYYLSYGTPAAAGDICIDCGACEGTFALQALEAGASRVICLEPSAEMANCLRKTLAFGIEDGRVTVINAAAGASNGETEFAFDAGSPFGGNISASGPVSRVPIRTLTDICRTLELSRLDFIKMDIEGAELQAVEGALPILKRFRPKLAITTYHRAFDYAALKALLTAAGYHRIKPAGCTGRGGDVFRPIMLHASR